MTWAFSLFLLIKIFLKKALAFSCCHSVIHLNVDSSSEHVEMGKRGRFQRERKYSSALLLQLIWPQMTYTQLPKRLQQDTPSLTNMRNTSLYNFYSANKFQQKDIMLLYLSPWFCDHYFLSAEFSYKNLIIYSWPAVFFKHVCVPKPSHNAPYFNIIWRNL